MQCYSELLPPTAVTDAIALNFIQSGERNLIVAKTSLLQVFKPHQDKDRSTTGLLLVGEYELSGTITSLRSIHTQDDKDGIESLLISFHNAKISLVRWDCENHRISTVSIHYYENDPVPRQPCDSGANHNPSILTVDPSSRCVALKFDQRQLAILPFKQQSEDLNELDEIDGEDNKLAAKQTNGTVKETPYKKSFVLSLPSLDESLTDVVDLAFLHDYREPTFGILTSHGQASSALWYEGKDILTYHILTLDLEQGASTILASIPQLPANLWKVQPLPAPFGGALLIGTDEIVHVAQSGKTHAVIVNEFAQLSGGFTTSDQSSLDLKLEDCIVDVLDSEAGDLIVALRDGSLAILHFTMIGPDVKALAFSIVSSEAGGLVLEGLPSVIAKLDGDLVFLGSDDADSLLVHCNKISSNRKRSHAEMTGVNENHEDEAEEDEDADDDDLYASTAKRTRASIRGTMRGPAARTALTYNFEVVDTLASLGPMSRPCMAKSQSSDPSKLELAAITGRGRGSKLALMTRNLRHQTSSTFVVDGAKAAWSVHAVKPKRKGQAVPPGEDNLLFVFNGQTTKAYQAPWSKQNQQPSSEDLTEVSDSEFEHDGETVEIGTLGSGRWIVHCRQTEVRTYEPDLSLSQIIPMTDEESDTELAIVHTSFSDPYLLIIRNDGTLQILGYESKSQDVEPVDLPEPLAKQKYISGCIYNGSCETAVAALLTDDGTLQLVSLPWAEVSYTALNLSHLPPILSSEAVQRRVGYKETLTEVLITDIGKCGHSQPYLILRTSADDLIVYEPFHSTPPTAEDWTTHLKFRKVPVPYLPRYDEYLDEASSQRIAPLKPIKINDYDAVIIPGKPPCLMISEMSSRPKVLRLQDSSLSSILTINQSVGDANMPPTFASLAKDGDLAECSLSKDISIEAGWNVQKRDVAGLDDELCHIAYHEESGMYVISTCKQVDFLFPEEDTRHAEQDEIKSRPKVPQYSLHLYSASTYRIINTYDFPPGEAITCVEVMPIDTSEHTHVVRPLVAVGTAFLRGEDMPARGALVLFDVQPVIPEPGDPETGIRLHVLSREGVKGAVTTVAAFVGNLIGISQGQKVMVRGMKEDGSCLPVAFLDCLCQLNSLKTLSKTGLWLAADSWKGLWFGGFTEDPYKLTFLSKSQTHMEVLCAEFLPFEGQLFILVIDADMDLHVLQYDPEDPKTVSGAKLLYRATFHLGQWPTSMILVPSTLVPLDEQATTNGAIDSDPDHQPLFHILITSQSGAVHLITPLDSGAYRRLTNLHGQMTSILEQPAALNPRDYRSSEGDATGARGVVDGMLIQRIGELGSARRAEVLGRCGSDAWTMRSDLEVISGGGLAWL